MNPLLLARVGCYERMFSLQYSGGVKTQNVHGPLKKTRRSLVATILATILFCPRRHPLNWMPAIPILVPRMRDQRRNVLHRTPNFGQTNSKIHVCIVYILKT